VVPSLIRHIAVDCADAHALAGFWSAVTGWPVAGGDNPGDEQVAVLPPDGSGIPVLLFIEVPERKTVENRPHLDVGPDDRDRASEVDRLVELGAAHIRDHIGPRGIGRTVLTDPEGNEFCVESSRDEIAAVHAAGS
jgi:predicted enzyme related to lactoylglutathione lyase